MAARHLHAWVLYVLGRAPEGGAGADHRPEIHVELESARAILGDLHPGDVPLVRAEFDRAFSLAQTFRLRTYAPQIDAGYALLADVANDVDVYQRELAHRPPTLRRDRRCGPGRVNPGVDGVGAARRGQQTTLRCDRVERHTERFEESRATFARPESALAELNEAAG